MSIQRFVTSLSAACADADVHDEAGVTYYFLSQLKVRVGDELHVMDALLCTTTHSGYTTRLFLERPISGRGSNWTVHQILGRPWHTWSWQGVPADLTPVQILLAHMDALR